MIHTSGGPSCEITPSKNSWKDYARIGAMLVVLWGLYQVLSSLHLIPKLTIHDEMSLGFVFLIGLVAASSSCIAVAGGLLLAVTTRFAERHPKATGFTRFRPHLSFNLGRILSYTGFGAAVGLLGSTFVFSSMVTAIVTAVAGIAMILAGFRLLNLFPWFTRFQPKLPRFIGDALFKMESSSKDLGPFLVGAATFFVPCGFTQALQLYVLARGRPLEGALVMLFFALGTLPSLLSVGAIASFAKGGFRKFFFRLSASAVILLGILSLSSAASLAGFGSAPIVSSDPNIEIVDGVQVARMKIQGLDYTPHVFRVKKNVPVEWRIDGTLAEGCAQAITIPKLGVTKYLDPKGETVIRFTPTVAGPIAFSCTMGMTTKGSAFIVEDETGSVGTQKIACDSAIADCKRS